MAGMAGFEPANDGVKVRCLAAWLHQLSYTHHLFCCGHIERHTRRRGALEGTRTPDPLLRRQLLYPPELQARIGAGDGNRTHVTSLEGWNSTIELHLHFIALFSINDNYYIMLLEICQLLFSKKVIFVEIALIIELTERKYINVVKKIMEN